MPDTQLWQIRYRVNDESDLQLYCEKLGEISGCTVIFGVNHFGTEAIFGNVSRLTDTTGTTGDQAAMVSTHCHILFRTAVPCSLYKCKKLIASSGIYDTPIGSVLGSRDKSVSVATDISGAMAYFLWEYVRSVPSKRLSVLRFYNNRHFPRDKSDIDYQIRVRAYEHYQAKREHYNRKRKRSGNKRIDIYNSFVERYSSGYTGKFPALYVEYNKALYNANLHCSSFIIERDVISIWLLNNPARQDLYFKNRAQAVYEKYFPESW